MITDWLLLKSQAINVLPGFGVSIIVLLSVLFFNPRPHILITVLCVGALLWEAYTNYHRQVLPSWYSVVWRQLVLIGYMLFVIYLTAFFGLWGIIGAILSGVVLALVILYRRRKEYMQAVRHIETLIWGKPLDKREEKK